MKKERIHYLRMDVKRLLYGYRIYVAVLGVTAALFFALESDGVNQGVVNTYIFATEMSGMMLVYVFCAFPYATAFSEDMENKYIRYQLIRGNLRKYVSSKISIIYISSVFVMLVGSLLFLLAVRVQVPWKDPREEIFAICMGGSYSALLRRGQYLLYCMIYALQLGFLAGTLSVFSAFVSLFLSNKVTVLVTPILVYQIFLGTATNTKVSIFMFRAYNQCFENDIVNLFFVFMVSLILVLVIAAGACRKIKERL